MPIIASQHQWKDKDHVPLAGWPEDCMVQWGGRGVVLSTRTGGTYGTAFFEAFPRDGGFIRGEGSTIAEAEEKALDQYRRSASCEHHWARGNYTNGGAICRRCKGFQTVFSEIVKLGRYREPLDACQLDMIAEGHMRPVHDDPKRARYARRNWLKARRMGIDLPDFDTAPPEPAGFNEDDYARACRAAVVKFVKANLYLLDSGAETGISGLFEGMHLRSLRLMVEEHHEEPSNCMPCE